MQPQRKLSATPTVRRTKGKGLSTACLPALSTRLRRVLSTLFDLCSLQVAASSISNPTLACSRRLPPHPRHRASPTWARRSCRSSAAPWVSRAVHDPGMKSARHGNRWPCAQACDGFWAGEDEARMGISIESEDIRWTGKLADWPTSRPAGWLYALTPGHRPSFLYFRPPAGLPAGLPAWLALAPAGAPGLGAGRLRSTTGRSRTRLGASWNCSAPKAACRPGLPLRWSSHRDSRSIQRVTAPSCFRCPPLLLPWLRWPRRHSCQSPTPEMSTNPRLRSSFPTRFLRGSLPHPSPSAGWLLPSPL